MNFILAWSEWDPNCDPNCPVTVFDHTVGEFVLLGIVVIVLYYVIENLARLPSSITRWASSFCLASSSSCSTTSSRTSRCLLASCTP